MARNGNRHPGRFFVVALCLVVAGTAGIVVNNGNHSIGVLGGVVTIVAGVVFFLLGVSARKTTAKGRRRFFMS